MSFLVDSLFCMYESTEWGGNNKLILNEIKQIINMLAFSFIEHTVCILRTVPKTYTAHTGENSTLFFPRVGFCVC